MNGTLVFDISSFWHSGTGRGDGTRADAVVARTREGLPYLRGRTVKGLVRDAARLAVRAGIPASEDLLISWFGSELIPRAEGPTQDRSETEQRERMLEEARLLSTPGTLRFSSATLSPEWGRWAREHPTERKHFVSRLASTRIGADGVASSQTLRVIEVAVPLTLRAQVSGLDGESSRVIGEALPLFLRGLGSHRNRGLGRVTARLEIPDA